MKTIAILAPPVDPVASAKMLYSDFKLQLKRSGTDLSFESLFHLANHSYRPGVEIPRTNVEREEIGAAGYYLSARLRENGYDTVLMSSGDDDVLEAVAKTNPVAVCVSTTMILHRESLAAIVRRIRRVMKEVLIVVGGVLVWKSYLMARSSAEHRLLFPCNKSDIDADLFVLSDHGIGILLRVLDEVLAKGSGADLKGIAGVAVPDERGEFRFTEEAKEAIDPDEDYVRWDLLDALPTRIPIRTSVGCPYRCRYCDFCYLFPRIRLRSPDSLRAELKTLKGLISTAPDRKPHVINFTDDNVFISPKRTVEICRVLAEVDVGATWSGFIRASSVGASNIGSIKASGLTRAWIGVESGDQGQLDRMNKRQKLADVKRGIELLDAEDISVLMTYVVGFPGETDATIDSTIAFLNDLEVSNSTYAVFPFVIYPLSAVAMPELRRDWDVRGIFGTWSHRTMSSDSAVRSCETVFRSVSRVPYVYPMESRSFLRRFDASVRRRLYSLRQQATVALMDQRPWDEVATAFAGAATLMGADPTAPAPEFRAELGLQAISAGERFSPAGPRDSVAR